MLACFVMIGATISDLFSQAQPIFRIPNPKNQNIPNTPSRFLNFSFSVQGISSLNCFQLSYKKAGKQLHCRLILETITRFKIVR